MLSSGIKFSLQISHVLEWEVHNREAKSHVHNLDPEKKYSL